MIKNIPITISGLILNVGCATRLSFEDQKIQDAAAGLVGEVWCFDITPI